MDLIEFKHNATKEDAKTWLRKCQSELSGNKFLKHIINIKKDQTSVNLDNGVINMK